MGNVLLFICTASCMLYSVRSGVKRVHHNVVLSGLRVSDEGVFHHHRYNLHQ